MQLLSIFAFSFLLTKGKKTTLQLHRLQNMKLLRAQISSLSTCPLDCPIPYPQIDWLLQLFTCITNEERFQPI
uniref:Putative ovule protein n=1 Tax=Solanum chacoense TaxID=4108 RepID=A0A0V0H125_SOLCH